MELTLNGIPITVDPIAAQEIVRKHLQNGDAPPDADLEEWHKSFQEWKAKATPELKPGEQLIGSYAGPDGKTTVAILLPGEASDLTWPKALEWAKAQGGDLPNRVEALLLFQHHRAEFQRQAYWTNEQLAEVSSHAWFQSFLGFQLYWHQDHELMARAVRRVTI